MLKALLTALLTVGVLQDIIVVLFIADIS
jgi:hypothetical protein